MEEMQMNCRSLTSLAKPPLLVLIMIFLCFSASATPAAKSRTSARPDSRKLESKSFTNAKGLKRYLFRIVGGKGKKLKAVSACYCAAAPEEWEAWGGCFKGCLTSWGLSYGSATTCGGICAIAATGNPIGIGVCAGCLGTAEWIVAGCAMSCAWARGGNTWLEQVRDSPPTRRTPKQVVVNHNKRIAGL
jgi:hypothetical protein